MTKLFDGKDNMATSFYLLLQWSREDSLPENRKRNLLGT